MDVQQWGCAHYKKYSLCIFSDTTTNCGVLRNLIEGHNVLFVKVFEIVYVESCPVDFFYVEYRHVCRPSQVKC
jgi:hypothetical protein